MHVALVGRPREGGMHGHRHGGRGRDHRDRTPRGALLRGQGGAAVALPFSPVGLRPSAVLQPGAALQSSPGEGCAVPGQVLPLLRLEPWGDLLLLLLAPVPARNLGAER